MGCKTHWPILLILHWANWLYPWRQNTLKYDTSHQHINKSKDLTITANKKFKNEQVQYMVLHQYKTPNPTMGQLTAHESKHHCVPRPVYSLPLNVPTPPFSQILSWSNHVMVPLSTPCSTNQHQIYLVPINKFGIRILKTNTDLTNQKKIQITNSCTVLNCTSFSQLHSFRYTCYTSRL